MSYVYEVQFLCAGPLVRVGASTTTAHTNAFEKEKENSLYWYEINPLRSAKFSRRREASTLLPFQ